MKGQQEKADEKNTSNLFCSYWIVIQTPENGAWW